MPLEDRFDTEFVARLAYKEKQIQQRYRPTIGIHKWFARRPGTLFRALMLAEFVNAPLQESFYRGHDLSSLVVADPFMGGGTPVIEANRLGMGVIGIDVNPMAYWIVRQSLAPLNFFEFRMAAAKIARNVEARIGDLYRTKCQKCGAKARTKYFLWTKVGECADCGAVTSLFPGYLVAKNERHTDFVWFCPSCENLAEVPDRPTGASVTPCPTCGEPLPAEGNASANRFTCGECGQIGEFKDGKTPPGQRLFALEYHCESCKPTHQGRFFKAPDSHDFDRVNQAKALLERKDSGLIPEEEIPEGDETLRLLRWGYRKYRDLFNPRQLLGLQILLEEIVQVEDQEVRGALATVFSDFLRYQNMLCRYDTWALKCQDIFSVHGFPAGLVRCENNLLGIPRVGSGGFRHFVEKYLRAKEYCQSPFEIDFRGDRKKVVDIGGEHIGAQFVETPSEVKGRAAFLSAQDARAIRLPANSLDAVYTDPPYFANVQYAELMDFCYVWLRKVLRREEPLFKRHTTRDPQELTVNRTLHRGITEFTEGMSAIFHNMTRALKPGSPLVFTYHHNDPEAYVPIAVSILDAGVSCTATLASPAEMSASLHINGTGSSIIDTIFVCRKQGPVVVGEEVPEFLGRLVEDVNAIEAAGVGVTKGDLLCMLWGALTRLTVVGLRSSWTSSAPTRVKMKIARERFESLMKKNEIDHVFAQVAQSTP